MSVPVLKYYLHDGSTCFRIQLLGTLSGTHVSELSGCWRTARSAVAGRPVVIDSARLEGLDDAGRAWLEEMVAEGAIIEDQDGQYTIVPTRFGAQEIVTKEDTASSGGRKWGRVRVPAIDSM